MGDLDGFFYSELYSELAQPSKNMSLMALEMSSFTELKMTFWNTVSMLNYKKIETSTSLR